MVPPLLALAAGLVISRLVSFAVSDLLWTLPILAGLTFLAWRISSRLMWFCGAALVLFCGALIETMRRPGLPPEVDANAHENVILDGCVVSPPGERIKIDEPLTWLKERPTPHEADCRCAESCV